jgi:hypothetical protein
MKVLMVLTSRGASAPRRSPANMRTSGVGHNLPQAAPEAFAKAVVDVGGY